MNLLKWIILAFLLVLVLFLGIGMFLPTSFSTERTITIEAPAEVVYQAITDLELWQEWEPWGQSDDTMEVTYGEQRAGEGASYAWEGDTTGTGSLRITSATPEKVQYELIFNEDEEHPAYSEMLLESRGADRTHVTWTFHGELGTGPVDRYFGLLIEPMVGEGFQQGLESLKEVTEERMVREQAGESEAADAEPAA